MRMSHVQKKDKNRKHESWSERNVKIVIHSPQYVKVRIEQGKIVTLPPLCPKDPRLAMDYCVS